MSKAIQLHNEEENIYPNPHFPVGSIYLSVLDTNPSKWFGGEWEQIAKGRTLVGVDTNDTDFNESQKTGGSKYMQAHKHEYTSEGHIAKYPGWVYDAGGDRFALSNSGYRIEDAGIAGKGDSENLQPYFTCYIWCRTA